MEEEDWDAVIAVHLKGHYCCTRPFVRYIKDQNRLDCRIINFSSVSGLFGNFGQANYGAAKAGIAGFSRVVAKEAREVSLHGQHHLARRGHAHDDSAGRRRAAKRSTRRSSSAARSRSRRW